MKLNNNPYVHEVVVFDNSITSRHYFADDNAALNFAKQYSRVRHQSFRIPQTAVGLVELLNAVLRDASSEAERERRAVAVDSEIERAR